MKFFSTLTTSLLVAGAIAAPNKAADECLKRKKVEASYPGDDDYAELAEPFNLRLQYKPAAIALPKNNKDVQNAVLCAAQSGLKVQARSGGHSYASFSSGGKNGSMVINLEYLQDTCRVPFFRSSDLSEASSVFLDNINPSRQGSSA